MSLTLYRCLRQVAFSVAIILTASSASAGDGCFGLFDSHHCDSACDIACCDDGGCDGCGLSGCGGDGCLCGLIKPSDRCFDDFISPMINFVHFEDPRTVTELRPIFVNHWVPDSLGNGVPAGGTIQLLAAQFRIALTDRLSIIAVKDGYIWDNTDQTLDLLLNDGWAATSAGLKYNFLRDPQSGTIASGGFTYEIPGSSSALQNIGDGEFHLFVTGGQRFLDGNAHFLSAFGWRVPVDGDAQTESIHWSNHLDFRVTNSIYLLTEIAWWHWTDGADNGLDIGFAGQDLFNLFAADATDLDLVTQNVGLKWKPNRGTEVGIAYEFPLTEFKDVIDSRLQTEVIFRY